MYAIDYRNYIECLRNAIIQNTNINKECCSIILSAINSLQSTLINEMTNNTHKIKKAITKAENNIITNNNTNTELILEAITKCCNKDDLIKVVANQPKEIDSSAVNYSANKNLPINTPFLIKFDQKFKEDGYKVFIDNFEFVGMLTTFISPAINYYVIFNGSVIEFA